MALLNGEYECFLPNGEPTHDFADAIEAGFWEMDYMINHGYYYLNYTVEVEVEADSPET